MESYASGFLDSISAKIGRTRESVLEEIAHQARADGLVPERSYSILGFRLPFEGYEKKTQKKLGMDYGVSYRMISILEKGALDVLAEYFFKYAVEVVGDVKRLDVRFLPWKKHDGTRTRNVLLNATPRSNTILTVGDVVSYLENNNPRSIPDYGDKRYRTTMAVFQEVGVELPQHYLSASYDPEELNRRVSDLGLSPRVQSIFDRLNIVYIGELVNLTSDDVKRGPLGGGQASVMQINRKLSPLKLKLNMKVDFERPENVQVH